MALKGQRKTMTNQPQRGSAKAWRHPFPKEAGSVALYILDAEGLVISAHTEATTMRGPGATEIVGLHFSGLLLSPEIGIGELHSMLVQARRNGQSELKSLVSVRHGHRFRVRVTFRALCSHNGHVGFALTITEQAQEASVLQPRRMSRRQTGLFLSNIVHCSMYSLTVDGFIRSWNPGAERIKGYKRQEVVGHHFEVFFTKEDVKSGVPATIVSTAKSLGRYEGEGWRVRKDGSRFWASVVLESIFDEEKNLVGFAKITRDMTASKELEAVKDALLESQLTERLFAEKRLRQLENELVQGARLTVLGEMASTLAHELNQPLAAIVNYLNGGARLIKEGGVADPDLLRMALEEASLQALRAGKIIDQARRYVSQGTIVTRLELLSEVILEAHHHVTINRTSSGPKTVFKFDIDVEQVSIDRLQILQVLLNLMRNAIEAMTDASLNTLTISTGPAHDPAYAQITVADTGPGIDPAIEDRLFNCFVTSKSEGMGVGLSICRTIIESHGGKIQARNKATGSGAEFGFTLPLAEQT